MYRDLSIMIYGNMTQLRIIGLGLRVLTHQRLLETTAQLAWNHLPMFQVPEAHRVLGSSMENSIYLVVLVKPMVFSEI